MYRNTLQDIAFETRVWNPCIVFLIEDILAVHCPFQLPFLYLNINNRPLIFWDILEARTKQITVEELKTKLSLYRPFRRMGGGKVPPLILNVDNGWRWKFSFTHPVPLPPWTWSAIAMTGRWAPEPVWTLLKEQSPSIVGKWRIFVSVLPL